MRLALHATGEVATRAGRILLAERGVTALGLVNQSPAERDSRLERVEVLATYDALITDAAAPEADIEMALTAGVSCAVWVDADEARDRQGGDFADAGLKLLTGCNLASGIAPSLLAHEIAAIDTVLETMTAWTEPGSPRRRGRAIPFPEPIGSRWATEERTSHADRAYVARVGGEWAAAMAQVTGASASGVVTRVVGVADLAVHLEALSLAVGGMLVMDYSPGGHRPADLADKYLARLLDAGLDVASHTVGGN